MGNKYITISDEVISLLKTFKELSRHSEEDPTPEEN